jgi:hypothetical protein
VPLGGPQPHGELASRARESWAMDRLTGLVVVGALAVAVSVVAAGPALAAKGGNNDTAKVCQKHGWKTLVPAAGGAFANQGDCVIVGSSVV